MKEGWEYKTLGEVGSFKRGGNFSKKDFVEKGFPCIHYGQIHMKFGHVTNNHLSCVPNEIVKEERCAKKGNLIIAITSEDEEGSCKCTAWMADYDAYVGGHTAIFSHTLNPIFMSYYFLSPLFQMEKLKYTHGFKVVEINPKDIAKIPVPVPSSSKQEEIVSYLDTTFANIDKLKENASKALSEAKALFQAALTEAIMPKEGWEEKTLKEIGSTYTGTTPSKSHIENYGDFMPFIRPSEVNKFGDGKIHYDSEIKLSQEGCNNGRVFSKNSILMVCIGATIGKVGFTDKEVSCNQQINVLTPNVDYDYKFIYYSMNSAEFQKKVFTVGTSAQATLPIINKTKWENLTLKFPMKSQQHEIVRHLDSLSSMVRQMEENYRKTLAECDALKQAILRDVFE